MNKFIFSIVFISVFLSCQKKIKKEILNPILNLEVNDSRYIINDSFPEGDVRRYGVFPNRNISAKYLKNIISLGSEGLPITFPRGKYNTNLVLNDVSNLNFIFKGSIISGAISILDGSNKVKFDGQLTVLDKLFIRNSTNITFDSLTIKTDTLLNLYHKKNRGVSIYVGSKNILFNSLIIKETGGTSDSHYKYIASALQIHGWNNNPEHVYIKKLEIIDADRTALYLTGKGHQIGKATIVNFGLGSTKNMFGLDDASPGEEFFFTGAWINRCNDCVIDSLDINSTLFNKPYSLWLDEGLYHQPTFINNIHFGVKAKELPIKDDLLTNILVKNEY